MPSSSSLRWWSSNLEIVEPVCVCFCLSLYLSSRGCSNIAIGAGGMIKGFRCYCTTWLPLSTLLSTLCTFVNITHNSDMSFKFRKIILYFAHNIFSLSTLLSTLCTLVNITHNSEMSLQFRKIILYFAQKKIFPLHFTIYTLHFSKHYIQ